MCVSGMIRAFWRAIIWLRKKRSSAKVLHLAKAKAKAKPPSKVEFKFIFPDTYNPVYANGAFGGIGPQRDLVINFYHERPPIPYSQTHIVNEISEHKQMTLGAEVDRHPKLENPLIVRFITAGIVMDEAFARRLHEWLGNKLQQYDELKKS